MEESPDIEDLSEIGDNTAKKLHDCGYETIESLATAKSKDIQKAIEIGESKAKKIIDEAKSMSEGGPIRNGRRNSRKKKRCRMDLNGKR